MHKVDDQTCMIEIVSTEEVNSVDPGSRGIWDSNVHAALLLYSITSRRSFSSIPKLHAKILRIFQLPIALIGNDIEDDERQVSTAEAQALANKLRCAFFEASVKGRVNVEEPITELVRKVRRQSLSLIRRDQS
jgi:GTPase KRas protein